MNFLSSFISESTAGAIGWTLLHTLWQGAFAAAVLAFAMYIAKNSPARLRALFASVALLLLPLMAGITFSIEYSRLLRESAAASHLSLPYNISLPNTVASQNSIDTVYELLAAPVGKFINLYDYHLTYIWLAGVLFFTLRLAGAHYILFKEKKRVIPVTNERFRKYTSRLNRISGALFMVKLAESFRVKVPAAAGYLKPVILLPVGMISGFPPEYIEAAIAHEIAHIKRFDPFLKLAQSVVEILFFYNPFMWMIARQLDTEREFACDDLAVKYFGDRETYAIALAEINIKPVEQKLQVALSISGRKNELLARMKRLFNGQNKANNSSELNGGITILIMAICLVALLKSFLPISNSIDSEQNDKNIIVFNSEPVMRPNSYSVPGVHKKLNVPANPSANVGEEEQSGENVNITFDVDPINTVRLVNLPQLTEDLYANLKNGISISIPDPYESVQPDESEEAEVPDESEKTDEEKSVFHSVSDKRVDRDDKRGADRYSYSGKDNNEVAEKNACAQLEYQEKMKEHNLQLKQHEKEMKQHELEMQKHEIEMQKHEQEMQKHDVEMKKYYREMKKWEREIQENERTSKETEKELRKAYTIDGSYEAEKRKSTDQQKKNDCELKRREREIKNKITEGLGKI